MAKLVRDTLPSKVKADPRLWEPYLCDDRAQSIDEWPGPWHDKVTGRQVDRGRTARLTEHDVPVSVTGGTTPWEGASSGKPWNMVDGAEKLTKVWNLSKKVTGPIWALKLPVEKLPLPDVVRRQSDPLGASDLGVILLRQRKELVEAITVEDRNPLQMLTLAPLAVLNGISWSLGYGGGGQGIYRYDLTKPWKPAMGGRTAAGVPVLPMLVRGDELDRGLIEHTLFCSLPNYSPEKPVGFATGTDGQQPGHPLRAGDILRLPAAFLDRWPVGSKEHTVARAMVDYGVMLGDKSGRDDGSMVIGCALDRRIGRIELDLRLSDFEVVVQ